MMTAAPNWVRTGRDGHVVMRDPEHEPQVAALREQIRWAGEDTCRGAQTIRAVVSGVILLVIGTATLPVVLMGHFSHQPAFWGLVVGGGLVGVPVAWLVAALSRAVHRFLIGRQLRRLPPASRAEVLVPLQGARVKDTRRLVGALLRGFPLPTELVPSGSVAGRGAEVSAPEHSTLVNRGHQRAATRAPGIGGYV
jgi:hypothetical protein